MSIDQVKKFFSDMKHNAMFEKFMSREFDRTFSVEQTFVFLKHKLIPFANQNGYDFDVKDYLEYKKQIESSGNNLSLDDLELVSGGAGGLIKKFFACSALSLTTVSVAMAAGITNIGTIKNTPTETLVQGQGYVSSLKKDQAKAQDDQDKEQGEKQGEDDVSGDVAFVGKSKGGSSTAKAQGTNKPSGASSTAQDSGASTGDSGSKPATENPQDASDSKEKASEPAASTADTNLGKDESSTAKTQDTKDPSDTSSAQDSGTKADITPPDSGGVSTGGGNDSNPASAQPQDTKDPSDTSSAQDSGTKADITPPDSGGVSTGGDSDSDPFTAQPQDTKDPSGATSSAAGGTGGTTYAPAQSTSSIEEIKKMISEADNLVQGIIENLNIQFPFALPKPVNKFPSAIKEGMTIEQASEIIKKSVQFGKTLKEFNVSFEINADKLKFSVSKNNIKTEKDLNEYKEELQKKKNMVTKMYTTRIEQIGTKKEELTKKIATFLNLIKDKDVSQDSILVLGGIPKDTIEKLSKDPNIFLKNMPQLISLGYLTTQNTEKENQIKKSFEQILTFFRGSESLEKLKNEIEALKVIEDKIDEEIRKDHFGEQINASTTKDSVIDVNIAKIAIRLRNLPDDIADKIKIENIDQHVIEDSLKKEISRLEKELEDLKNKTSDANFEQEYGISKIAAKSFVDDLENLAKAKKTDSITEEAALAMSMFSLGALDNSFHKVSNIDKEPKIVTDFLKKYATQVENFKKLPPGDTVDEKKAYNNKIIGMMNNNKINTLKPIEHELSEDDINNLKWDYIGRYYKVNYLYYFGVYASSTEGKLTGDQEKLLSKFNSFSSSVSDPSKPTSQVSLQKEFREKFKKIKTVTDFNKLVNERQGLIKQIQPQEKSIQNLKDDLSSIGNGTVTDNILKKQINEHLNTKNKEILLVGFFDALKSVSYDQDFIENIEYFKKYSNETRYPKEDGRFKKTEDILTKMFSKLGLESIVDANERSKYLQLFFNNKGLENFINFGEYDSDSTYKLIKHFLKNYDKKFKISSDNSTLETKNFFTNFIGSASKFSDFFQSLLEEHYKENITQDGKYLKKVEDAKLYGKNVVDSVKSLLIKDQKFAEDLRNLVANYKDIISSNDRDKIWNLSVNLEKIKYSLKSFGFELNYSHDTNLLKNKDNEDNIIINLEKEVKKDADTNIFLKLHAALALVDEIAAKDFNEEEFLNKLFDSSNQRVKDLFNSLQVDSATKHIKTNTLRSTFRKMFTADRVEPGKISEINNITFIVSGNTGKSAGISGPSATGGSKLGTESLTTVITSFQSGSTAVDSDGNTINVPEGCDFGVDDEGKAVTYGSVELALRTKEDLLKDGKVVLHKGISDMVYLVTSIENNFGNEKNTIKDFLDVSGDFKIPNISNPNNLRDFFAILSGNSGLEEKEDTEFFTKMSQILGLMHKNFSASGKSLNDIGTMINSTAKSYLEKYKTRLDVKISQNPTEEIVLMRYIIMYMLEDTHAPVNKAPSS